jgi:AcrR family transcriptional regulator
MTEPLRARKKATTRQAISDAATRLFEIHGFDAVTLADVAQAADVSVKTVWNYFGSKDELFFDRESQTLAELLRAIRGRPGGLSPSSAVGPLLRSPFVSSTCRWVEIDADRYRQVRAYYMCETSSQALSDRRLAIINSWTEPLSDVSRSALWAAMLTGTIVLRHRRLASGFIERKSVRAIQESIRSTVTPAVEALNRAFPE